MFLCSRNWRPIFTYISTNNAQTLDRGWNDGGVVAVLLNTDASSIDKATDEIVVGAKYENILGNIGEAIGASTTTIIGPNGEDVEVMQLPNGLYVFVYASYQAADNKMLYQNLALSLLESFMYQEEMGLILSHLKMKIDNIYEFVFQGATFSDLKLQQEQWVVIT